MIELTGITRVLQYITDLCSGGQSFDLHSDLVKGLPLVGREKVIDLAFTHCDDCAVKPSLYAAFNSVRNVSRRLKV